VSTGRGFGLGLVAAGFIACTSAKSDGRLEPIPPGDAATGGVGATDASGGVAGTGASDAVGGSSGSAGVEGGDASDAAGSAGTSDAEAGDGEPPTAASLVMAVVEGTRKNVAMLPALDRDPAARLTHRIVRDALHGTVTLIDPARGSVNYESRAGETGVDSFAYEVNDGLSDSTSAGEVSVQVLALGPAPLKIDPPETWILGPNLVIDGDTAILGSLADDVHDGAAFIGRRQSDGTWKLIQRLTAGDRAPNVFRFGEYVALDGDFALVGAWGEWASPPPSGAAFFFKRGANGQFEPFQFHEGPEPAAGDQFGGNPRISGNRAIVNGRAENTRWSTQVHVYRLEGGSDWTRTKTLRSPRQDIDDFFGASTDLEGDTIVVSASHDNEGGPDAGAAYIFRSGPVPRTDAADAGSDAAFDSASDAPPEENWSVLKKLFPREAGGKACLPLALAQNTVLCGAPLAFEGHGAAYAFSIEGDDSFQVLRPPVDEQDTVKSFGTVVAIDGDTAAVAPDGAANEDHGVAYIFRRIAGKWEYHRKIGTGTSTIQLFPMGLAVDGPTVIATSPIENDSSYVFHVPLAGTD
jgi:hypothetical protein